MNIDALLLAAEYLERKDREAADHRYASTLPCPVTTLRPIADRRKAKLRQLHASSSRSTHNELEKNRRAHMKQCLELLKAVVPLTGDLSRHTTLGLLNNATALIKALRDADRRQSAAREDLVRDQQRLRWRLAQLALSGVAGAPPGGRAGAGPPPGHQYRVRPSVSESSSGSVESSGSSPNCSELDDIDVTGSDVDDERASSDTADICSVISSHRLAIS